MDRVTEVTRKNGVARIRMLSGEELRVPSAVFLERRVRCGEPLDPGEYRLFVEKRGYSHALEIAVKFLALRERSEGEIQTRLRRSCYPDSVIAQVMATLSLHDLVSDQRFAEQWVGSRSKRYGRGRIAQELRMKGVSAQDAQQALEQFEEEEELRQACAQARKLAKKWKQEPMKITQALVRRGYSWSLARKAVQAAQDERADIP